MRLRIRHCTTYRYAEPVAFGLQQLRLTPKSRMGQSVLTWGTEITGGARELEYEDQHANRVMLVSFSSEGNAALQGQPTNLAPQSQQQQQQSQQQSQGNADPGHVLSILSEGEVETADTSGVVGKHAGFAPLWYFKRPTPLTRAGAGVRSLSKGLSMTGDDQVARCHELMARVSDAVKYEAGTTTATTTAEEALAAGQGVCQDHAQVFIAAVRHLGLPARYVSGYLMIDGQEAQEASHGWAEAYIEPLGWVGFDAANGISPDPRYVRVATGLDYAEAAPVTGLRDAQSTAESLTVEIEVALLD